MIARQLEKTAAVVVGSKLSLRYGYFYNMCDMIKRKSQHKNILRKIKRGKGGKGEYLVVTLT